MTEKRALTRIYALPRFGGAASLAPMQALMEALGNPQRALRFVHIAGTNGKGSTATMIAAALTADGERTGLYTSPYINHFRERFQIDGKPVSPRAFCEASERVLAAISALPEASSISQFDAVTAIGLLLFAEAGCDTVVLECGLGGRLDATNIIPPPAVAVITNIGLDHTEVLGKTPAAIAREKAGILKSGTSLAVFAPQDYPEAGQVLEEVARERGIPFVSLSLGDISLLECGLTTLTFTYRGRPFTTHLAAPYQAKNAAGAVAALDGLLAAGILRDGASIAQGLLSAYLPARLEAFSLSPCVLLDGAHNEDGVRALQNTMEILSGQYARLFCLVGALRDKRPEQALAPFFTSPLLRKKLGGVLCMTPDSPRACPAEELAARLSPMLGGLAVSAPRDLPGALATCLSEMREGDVLLAFGSLYLMGELRRMLPPLLKENAERL